MYELLESEVLRIVFGTEMDIMNGENYVLIVKNFS
jgi:hypothetical protein